MEHETWGLAWHWQSMVKVILQLNELQYVNTYMHIKRNKQIIRSQVHLGT